MWNDFRGKLFCSALWESSYIFKESKMNVRCYKKKSCLALNKFDTLMDSPSYSKKYLVFNVFLTCFAHYGNDWSLKKTLLCESQTISHA